MQSAFFVLPNQYISPPPVCQQRFFSFLNIFQIRRQEYSLNSLEGAFKPASRRSGQAISRRPSEAKGGVLNGEPEQPERARAESAEQPEGAAPEPEGKPQVSSSFPKTGGRSKTCRLSLSKSGQAREPPGWPQKQEKISRVKI